MRQLDARTVVATCFWQSDRGTQRVSVALDDDDDGNYLDVVQVHRNRNGQDSLTGNPTRRFDLDRLASHRARGAK